MTEEMHFDDLIKNIDTLGKEVQQISWSMQDIIDALQSDASLKYKISPQEWQEFFDSWDQVFRTKDALKEKLQEYFPSSAHSAETPETRAID